MKTKFVGGVLLIVGTSIGGGILGLPLANAQAGVLTSLLLLLAVWAVMTFAALLLLEVNLRLPKNNNIITMAEATLGRHGRTIAWVTYLLLLYALLSLYTAGTSSILRSILASHQIEVSVWLSVLLIHLITCSFMYRGIATIDKLNRGLVAIKALLFVGLIMIISPHIELPQVSNFSSNITISGLTVIVTSFGFAIIIPSLRAYLQDDSKLLRKTVLCGSAIPLLCYALWILITLGTLPLNGDKGLITIAATGDAATGLINTYQYSLHSLMITHMMQIFVPVSVTTSLLGVTLSLADFLADGLHLGDSTLDKLKAYALTFIPPALLVIYAPNLFILALGYAGTLCLILLVLLPCLMAWSARYHNYMPGPYRVVGGKTILGLVIILSSMAILLSLLNDLHWL